jgi:hypothetical protein
MSAVTLAVQMENDYLGFDFAEEMVENANVGDVVTLTYDFGDGPRRVVGTYEGRETRDSGEVFVWVLERDAAQARYAIPMGMVEGLRIEARATSLPEQGERVVLACDDKECGATVTNVPADASPDDRRCPRCHGATHEVTNAATAKAIGTATKPRHDLSHHLRSREGRVCARLDYEGMVL